MGADMAQPYTAVGLIPTFWGARRRDDIKKNLDHLSLTLAILEKRSSGQLNTTSSKTPVSSAAR
jgi:hypothetical protein